jgi:predicted RNA-binding protein
VAQSFSRILNPKYFSIEGSHSVFQKMVVEIVEVVEEHYSDHMVDTKA